MSSSNIQSEKHFQFRSLLASFMEISFRQIMPIFFGESDDSGTSGDYSESGDFRDSDSIDTIEVILSD